MDNLSVDLDAAGKHRGAMRIPHSRQSSAWGTLDVPFASIRGSAGPCVLLVGGSHGDEYEGPIVLHELIASLEPATLRGHVLVVPELNLPAVKVGRRLSPVDGGNMNRVFPGNPKGGLTERIAHVVATQLVPRADVVVDIHSGGESLEFVPMTLGHVLPDRALQDRTEALMHAFRAPFGLLHEELDADGMLDTLVERQKKVFLSTELGGGARVTPTTMGIARRGVRNVLAHLEMIDSGLESGPPCSIYSAPSVDCYVFASGAGFFEPLVELGSEVRAGDVVGVVHPAGTHSGSPRQHVAAVDGTLLAVRARSLSEPGDCLALVGAPV